MGFSRRDCTAASQVRVMWRAVFMAIDLTLIVIATAVVTRVAIIISAPFVAGQGLVKRDH